MTRLLTSGRALALAAIAFACPAHAMPKGGAMQACLAQCAERWGAGWNVACQNYCRDRVGTGTNRAAISRRYPKPASIHPRSSKH
jgi:hypothetical protein